MKNLSRYSQFFFLFAVSAIWFVIGWVGRGYALGPEAWMVENTRQLLLAEGIREDISPRSLTYAAIRGMLAYTGDLQAGLLEPGLAARFGPDFAGESGVTGVIADIVREELVVTAVFPGEPADLAGLREGDRILSIDGQIIEPWTSTLEAALLVRGPVGEAAEFVVEREGEVLAISPVRVPRPIVEYEKLPGGIGYIAQYTFSTSAADKMRTALESLLAEGVTGIIWDLRINSGGSMHTAQEILSMFIEEGLLFTVEARSESFDFQAIEEAALAAHIPVVVLISEYSYSAAETSAAVFQYLDRGTVIGSTSHGKGTVQNALPLPDGSALQYTFAYWLTPDGQGYDQAGVQPDIEVLDTPGTEADEVIQFAVGLLR